MGNVKKYGLVKEARKYKAIAYFLRHSSRRLNRKLARKYEILAEAIDKELRKAGKKES